MYTLSLRMKNNGVPILSKAEIDAIGERFVQDFQPEVLTNLSPVDIEGFMPKRSVDRLARSCKDTLKNPTSRAILIAKMSDCFDVSIQAATNRLKDLGYIKTNDTTDYSYASAIMDFAGVVGS